MSTVIVTEKPSVARDIAAVLGVKNKSDGFLANASYKVTWAYGHLVGLAEPHQMNPAWKNWRSEHLPILPATWPLEVVPNTAKQFKVIADLLNDLKTDMVICATDAGREGELIFRYIYEKASCRKPVMRLWISSLTPEAIKAGLDQLKEGAEFDGLADSARARSCSDWLVGMNLSRAYSLSTGKQYSVGRVQTPTLAMVVQREKEILEFVPEDYVVIQGLFCQDESPSYRAYYFVPNETIQDQKEKTGEIRDGRIRAKRFKVDDPEIKHICDRLPTADLKVWSMKEKSHRLPPPLLYDLTELQRHANRIFGFSAEKTLQIAQSLYEESKLITYPRTDSRYLPHDMESKLNQVVIEIAEPFLKLIGKPLQIKNLGSRYINDTKISDHHAILPTGKQRPAKGLSSEQEKLFDMICRRVVMPYLEDYQYMASEVVIRGQHRSNPTEKADHFFARGHRILELGWKTLDFGQDQRLEADKSLPAILKKGASQKLESIEAIKRRTTPPPRLTDATLLTAMETAGSTLDDKELSDAMREHGLGTPATRSSIIENLIKRQYMVREKRFFCATQKGIELIDLLHEEIKSPALTGEWELKLNQIRQGKATLKGFMDEIAEFVKRSTIEALGKKPNQSSLKAQSIRDPVLTSSRSHSQTPMPDNGLKVMNSADLSQLLRKYFGFKNFRPHQETVCQDLVNGHDVLLVMPTGAGKSLCYQLPGLALGGRCLVISPLIALMDDQVFKLQELGLSAAAIHSGKSREESREICRLYALGQIPFLFVAPERLAVPGFVDFLAKHKPSLIAIDEAHCISHWGHDFRYDYRRLAERLAPLRPAVFAAMTATATPRVQQDIIDQLALQKPIRHIHGFRRTNIAIENVEMSKRDRDLAILQILKDRNRLPAIIYAPTRKEAEQTAKFLTDEFPCAAYHAGMSNEIRSRVQEDFLAGRLEVIVATTAFGMGVDKADIRTVIHKAVPGSLESFYQEIGRAGRDGKDSRSILLYSYADLKTHEYFHQANYPDVKELKEIGKLIPKSGIHISNLEFPLPPEVIQNHIERLVMIGALRKGDNGWIFPEKKRGWEKTYQEQKEHRLAQLMEMNRYVNQSLECRMLRLMAHFGDEDAKGDACGICDICRPENCQIKELKTLSAEEVKLGKILVERLVVERRPVALGTLFRDLGQHLNVKKTDFDRLIQVLIQEDIVTSQQLSFNKSGEIIQYRAVNLKVKQETIDWSSLKIFRASLSSIANDRGSKSHATSRSRGKTAHQKGEIDESLLDMDLLEKLKKWRKSEAQKQKVPAYCILNDRSLKSLALDKPKDTTSLLSVHGIGPNKVEQYGTSLLSILSQV